MKERKKTRETIQREFDWRLKVLNANLIIPWQPVFSQDVVLAKDHDGVCGQLVNKQCTSRTSKNKACSLVSDKRSVFVVDISASKREGLHTHDRLYPPLSRTCGRKLHKPSPAIFSSDSYIFYVGKIPRPLFPGSFKSHPSATRNVCGVGAERMRGGRGAGGVTENARGW